MAIMKNVRARKGYKSKGPRTRTPWKANISSKQLDRTVMRVIKGHWNKNVETKSGVISGSEGVEILHNNFISRTKNILATNIGAQDNENDLGRRVGDKITLSGVSIKAMFELNERYSDVTMRVLVIRSAKGDTPTMSTLWNGASPNKMIDTIDIERYTIMYGKTFKIKAPNMGMIPAGTQAVGSGWAVGTQSLSRATRIVKIWIPGKKFSRNRIIQYENNTQQVKFFDYHLLYYAYSNYDTAEVGGLPPTSYNVARVNDEVIKMYYKDA